MSYFSSKFYRKEQSINRSLNIDEDLYIELERLSNNVYDASITKLVNAAIERLIETENIQIYERKNKSYVSRSFLVRESFLDGLYNLKDKYGVSICLLINVAIRNALLEERVEKIDEFFYNQN
ncbi:MAG: hypothetical protein ILA02_02180 [Clostridia bacterium]|nr:hypothetical protein [Clostridia bacterium]